MSNHITHFFKFANVDMLCLPDDCEDATDQDMEPTREAMRGSGGNMGGGLTESEGSECDKPVPNGM